MHFYMQIIPVDVVKLVAEAPNCQALINILLLQNCVAALKVEFLQNNAFVVSFVF